MPHHVDSANVAPLPPSSSTLVASTKQSADVAPRASLPSSSRAASSSSSSLLDAVPAPLTGTSLLLCLAALLSAGVLIRTLHPRYRYRTASSSSKGNKGREHVIKKIIAQQEATLGDRAPARDLTRSSNDHRRLDISAKAKAAASTTSTTIRHGLARITEVATAAIASTSAVKLDADERVRPTSRDSTFPTMPANSQSGDAFSTSVGHTLTADSATRRGGSKGRKGKQMASVGSGSHASSLTQTPVDSPTRRTFMKDSATMSDEPATSDVAVQTTSLGLPGGKASGGRRTAEGTIANGNCDGDEVPENSDTRRRRPPDPPPPSVHDVECQTSPQLAPRSVRMPSLPRPFDLHASFQSTPPALMPPITDSSFPPPSPPGSPSPSRRPAKTSSTSTAESSPIIAARSSPDSSLRAPSRGRGDSSSTPSVTASPQYSASRSRKQARKASAAAAASDKVVVGLPRPGRSRTATGESGDAVLAAGEHVKEKGKGKSREGAEDQEEDARAAQSSGMANGKPLAPPLSIITDGEPVGGTNSGSSIASSSNASSPYLSRNALMNMTPASTNPHGLGLERRSSAASGVSSQESWSAVAEDENLSMVGLAIELSEQRRDPNERRRSSSRLSSEGRHAHVNSGHGRVQSRSWSSTGGSSSPTVPSLSDSYFPTAAASTMTAFTTPDSSPHPQSRLLPLTSTTSAGSQQQQQQQQQQQKYWSPQLMAQLGSGHPSNAQSRPASRQSSLSVPTASSNQQPTPATLQQQQAYAFYAHAQAQYQHVLALQIQAQQHHQRQQAAAAAARQRHDSEHSNSSISNGVGAYGGQQPINPHQQQAQPHSHHYASSPSMSRPPPTPNGYVYPISSSSNSIPQTPRSMSHSWAQQMSPSMNGVPFPSIASSASPTSASFSAANQHLQQQAAAAAAAAQQMSAYYFSSPTTSQFPSTYSMASIPSQQQQQRQGSASSASANPRSSTSEPAKKSPRPSAERQRTTSSTTTTTLPSPSTPNVVQDSTGWKIKVRTAEMEADRSAKELEIARWRLVVLEEESRQVELENQEALRTLATRAMRAEARIKLLEESKEGKEKDSSSTGSASPAARAAAELGASPSGRLHPLAWLDLDQVSFSVRPPSNSSSRPPFPSSNSQRRRSGRSSGEFPTASRRRSGANRARRSNGHSQPIASPRPPDEEDEEEILVLLDSPMRPPMQASTSRRSSTSFLGDDFSIDVQDRSAFLDDEELSAYDMDDSDARSTRAQSEVEYIGSLPTFLTPGPGSNRSRSPSVAATNSPRLRSDFEEEEEEYSSDVDRHESGTGTARDPDVSLPSFVLDRATSDVSEHEEPITAKETPVDRPAAIDVVAARKKARPESLSPVESPAEETTPRVPSTASPGTANDFVDEDQNVENQMEKEEREAER